MKRRIIKSTGYVAVLGILGLWMVSAFSGTILGTKHDFTGLNERAGVVAMPTVAFSDLGESCVYCHIPPDKGDVDSSTLEIGRASCRERV